jgi:hypothetical protein
MQYQRRPKHKDLRFFTLKVRRVWVVNTTLRLSYFGNNNRYKYNDYQNAKTVESNSWLYTTLKVYMSLNIIWSTISKANDFAIVPLVSPDSSVDKVTRYSCRHVNVGRIDFGSQLLCFRQNFLILCHTAIIEDIELCSSFQQLCGPNSIRFDSSGLSSVCVPAT